MIPDSIEREIERAIQAAEFPTGASVHDGKAKVDASHLRRLMAELAALRADALRYRWLRAADDDVPPLRECCDFLVGADLDAAIDARIDEARKGAA